MLIQRALTGEWRPAQMLPSEMKPAEEYGVSQGTVRKAIKDMAADNLAKRYQGRVPSSPLTAAPAGRSASSAS